jgi:tRNA (guanine-N7-)-methyltransferase
LSEQDPIERETEGGGAFYGRRKGKKLRAGQADLVETLLPRLRIDLKNTLSPETLFPIPVTQLWLEIGFGGGEHLLMQAEANPSTGFIGCEPFVNGMAKMLSAIDRDSIRNIRLYDADALHVLKHLPDASIDRLYLLYPDPWPKRRQNKRRFVSDETIALFARVLKPGGEFRFASDIDHYVGWTLERAMRSPHLLWTAKGPDDWRKPWPGWQSTRYELKAQREGRQSAYLTFLRT